MQFEVIATHQQTKHTFTLPVTAEQEQHAIEAVMSLIDCDMGASSSDYTYTCRQVSEPGEEQKP